MEKIIRFFRPVFKLNYKYPYAVIGVSILLGVIASFYALRLTVNTDIANLLPEDNPYVKALEDLQETIGGETRFKVVIEGPNFKKNKQFAKQLIDQTMQLKNQATDKLFFERAYFRKETEMIEKNALYFATSSELQSIIQYLKDETKEAKQKANPFFVDLTPDEEKDTKDDELEGFKDKFASLVPTEYAVSSDSTLLMVQFLPAGSTSDIEYLSHMFASYDSLLATMNIPAGMNVEYGGRLQLRLVQFRSVMSDVFNSFGIGVGTVIFVVALYFFIKKYVHYRRGDSKEQTRAFWEHAIRMPFPVVIIGLPLLISLAWTFCITFFALGTLNIMTAVLFVILFGLGIDYGIHFYGRYIELRSEGRSTKEALTKTYNNTGEALISTSLTTAVSLFVLIFAHFRGFSEFGFIAGTGIIMAVLCMLLILPAIIVIFDRWNLILINETVPEKQNLSLFNRFPYARSVVVVGLLISLVVIAFSYKLDFQYDFGELEPEIPEYRAFRSLVGKISDGNSSRRNPAYILTDSRQQVQKVANILRHRMKTDTLSPTILAVEALPERFPSTDSAKQAKLDKIAKIRQLMQDPFIKNQEGEMLNKLRMASQSTKPISLDEIPEFFKSQFLTKSGEIGNFVIVYASGSLANGRRSIAFKEDVGKITLESGETFYAASSSIIAAEMLDMLSSEAPWMVSATMVMIIILVWISFRSIKWTFIAIMPLVVGFLWLFGIMIITGMMFNLYNLVVLPAILGIGDDCGIHLAHRYLEDGKGSMGEVIFSTGQHVFMASVTTMLGFVGMIFADHPGLQSLGVMGVVGIGATLLAAFVFLPALIQWFEHKGWV